jgi:predicted phosphoribosyltransferase
MVTIGIGELQRDTSIITKLREAIKVVDKRKKQEVAIIYPIASNDVISKLAGKYANRIDSTISLDQIKTDAMTQALSEKYGHTS